MPAPSPYPPFVVPPPREAVGDEAGLNKWSTFAINPATGDWEIPLRIVRGVEAIRLRLLGRYQLVKREWFLDQRQGIPLFERILIKNPHLGLITSIYRRATLQTPGVKKVKRLEVKLDTLLRTLTIQPLEIILTGGVVYRSQPDDFVLSFGRNE